MGLLTDFGLQYRTQTVRQLLLTGQLEAVAAVDEVVQLLAGTQAILKGAHGGRHQDQFFCMASVLGQLDGSFYDAIVASQRVTAAGTLIHPFFEQLFTVLENEDIACCTWYEAYINALIATIDSIYRNYLWLEQEAISALMRRI